MIKYLLTLLAVISILCFHILYIFQDKSFLQRQFDQLHTSSDYTLFMSEAMVLRQYRRDDRRLVDRPVYTLAEQQHLADVKQILHGIARVAFFTFIFSMVSLFADRHKSIKAYLLALGIITAVCMLLGLFLWLVSVFARDGLFSGFHRLVFVDNWTFPSDSFLIQSYPASFFRQAMTAILSRSLMTVLVVIAILLFIRSQAGTKSQKTQGETAREIL